MELAKVYKIETERLLLRCYQPSDVFMLRNAIVESLDHLMPWMPWAKNEPEDLEGKISRIRQFRGNFDLGNDYVFGIFNKTESELIGSTGLHNRVGEFVREIGYWIHVKHINKGFALESASALTKVGFEIERLSGIEIRCAPNNIRSQNIPIKLGYQFKGSIINSGFNPPHDEEEKAIWRMDKTDYKKSPIQKMELNAFDIIGRPIHF